MPKKSRRKIRKNTRKHARKNTKKFSKIKKRLSKANRKPHYRKTRKKRGGAAMPNYPIKEPKGRHPDEEAAQTGSDDEQEGETETEADRGYPYDEKLDYNIKTGKFQGFSGIDEPKLPPSDVDSDDYQNEIQRRLLLKIPERTDTEDEYLRHEPWYVKPPEEQIDPEEYPRTARDGPPPRPPWRGYSDAQTKGKNIKDFTPEEHKEHRDRVRRVYSIMGSHGEGTVVEADSDDEELYDHKRMKDYLEHQTGVFGPKDRYVDHPEITAFFDDMEKRTPEYKQRQKEEEEALLAEKERRDREIQARQDAKDAERAAHYESLSEKQKKVWRKKEKKRRDAIEMMLDSDYQPSTDESERERENERKAKQAAEDEEMDPGEREWLEEAKQELSRNKKKKEKSAKKPKSNWTKIEFDDETPTHYVNHKTKQAALVRPGKPVPAAQPLSYEEIAQRKNPDWFNVPFTKTATSKYDPHFINHKTRKTRLARPEPWGTKNPKGKKPTYKSALLQTRRVQLKNTMMNDMGPDVGFTEEQARKQARFKVDQETEAGAEYTADSSGKLTASYPPKKDDEKK